MFLVKLNVFIKNNYWVAFMSIITLVVLFISDIKYLCIPISEDVWINSFNLFCLICFSFELIASSLSQNGYLNGFYFWLDLLATLSLIMEIDWIFLKLIGADSDKGSSTLRTISKVSSASRLIRVLRVIRVIRLIRIIKLYKNVILAREIMLMNKKKKEEKIIGLSRQTEPKDKKSKRRQSVQFFDRTGNNVQNEINSPIKLTKKASLKKEDEKEEVSLEESKTSKIISESITKQVIIMIMVMLFVLPVLADEFWAKGDTGQYEIYVEYAAKFYDENDTFNLNETIVSLLESELDDNKPVVKVQKDEIIFWTNPKEVDTELRYDEVRYFESKDESVILEVNITYELKWESSINIIKTVFTCLVLTVSTLIIERDIKLLVLEPLEVMIEIVEKVAKDPMNAKNVNDIQSGMKATLAKMENKNSDVKNTAKENYEVVMIQSAIIKIAALLAIGFGEAGRETIKSNMQSNEELNPMSAGKKVNCIFGFCDIRGFAMVNEAIQEKTMIFVNEISEVIHSMVDRFGGAVNKNIGDAFLCAWSLKDKEGLDNEVSPDNFVCQRMADLALLSYITSFREINSKMEIYKYKEEPKIKMLLNNYKVNMGFGLHVGWGIEGAVGSSYKIDCSYLSPNVNIAARLEAATRQYGVNILISGEMYELLSPGIKNLCRCIDIVAVKGSIKPIALYTVDLNANLKVKHSLKITSQKKKKEYFELRKKKFEMDLLNCGSTFEYIINVGNYEELFKCKQNTPDFSKTWDEGLLNYKNGNWLQARNCFKKCLKICPDGPANTLLDFMSEYSFEAPETWQNYRELTSK